MSARNSVNNRLTQAFCGALATDIASEYLAIAFAKNAFNRGDDRVTGFLVAKVLEHHRA